MAEFDYKSLLSGTDIRGVASEGVEGESVNLTNPVIAAVCGGFALWLCEKTGKNADCLTVSVGRDCRISGERIAGTVTDTLSSFGIRVLDCGLASTPSMFMTTVELFCDGAVQITASHHPFNRNGLKFFTPDGGLEKTDILRILGLAALGSAPKNSDRKPVEKTDYMSTYAKNLREIIKSEVNSPDYEHPLSGMHIVVDAGNGVGGFYATEVIGKLGADISGSQFLMPDGHFPNHIPNPEDKTAMESVCSAVKRANADLGVIFDTDVDRGGAVDSSGKEINRNRLVAVAAAIALEGCPGGTVVTDSITSDGLREFIEGELHGKHYRYRRGYKNVIDKAIELNKNGIVCPLAIETSGHAAMKKNYFLDDGAYLCTKIIIKAAQYRATGRDISELTAALKEPAEEKEIRIKITDSDFAATGNRVIDRLTEYAESQPGWRIADDNREGIRVSFAHGDGDGWFLLRLSVHDPIMPLNIESNSVGGVEIIERKIMTFLQTEKGLLL